SYLHLLRDALWPVSEPLDEPTVLADQRGPRLVQPSQFNKRCAGRIQQGFMLGEGLSSAVSASHLSSSGLVMPRLKGTEKSIYSSLEASNRFFHLSYILRSATVWPLRNSDRFVTTPRVRPTISVSGVAIWSAAASEA